MSDGEEYWYRFEDGTAYADGTVSVRIERFRVIVHTPKGVWLHAPNENNGVHGGRKLVLQPNHEGFRKGYDPGRRFAYPDEAMALWSYRRRKEVQAGKLRVQLDRAERLHAAVRDGKYERVEGFFGTYLNVKDGRKDDFRFEEY